MPARSQLCPITDRRCGQAQCLRDGCVLAAEEQQRQRARLAAREEEQRRTAEQRAALGLDGSP
jgi:hypothetical protein